MTTKEEPKQEISEEAKKRAKNYMSLKGALEPKQIKCYCGHTTYCDCSPIETTPNKTNMTQTAVDWLFLMMNNPNKNQNFANKLLKQAKEMEKEQIYKALCRGHSDCGVFTMTSECEQYYSETFNQNPTSK